MLGTKKGGGRGGFALTNMTNTQAWWELVYEWNPHMYIASAHLNISTARRWDERQLYLYDYYILVFFLFIFLFPSKFALLVLILIGRVLCVSRVLLVVDVSLELLPARVDVQYG